jgi:hypothetical protein
MRFLIAALSAAGFLISANTDAFADKRVAFVVGNGAPRASCAGVTPT